MSCSLLSPPNPRHRRAPVATRFATLFAPLFVTLLLALLLVHPALAQGKLALVGGTLIDGSGAEPMPDSVILIDGERIERVGRVGRMAIPDEYQLISTEGMTVLPGLWDPHVYLAKNGHPDTGHWFSRYGDRLATETLPATGRQLLLAGVTGARDLGAPTAAIVTLRERIDHGELVGPRLRLAGARLGPDDLLPGPHQLPITGIEEARDRTLSLIAAGVDFILVTGVQPAFLDELQTIVQTAHSAGLRVGSHADSDEEVRLGLAAGVDEFIHIGTDSAAYPPDILDAIVQRLADDRPLYWSPSVGQVLNADELAADGEYLDDPRNYAGLPEDIRRDIRQAIAAAEHSAASPETTQTVLHKIQQLNELGVIFVSGSGAGSFGRPAPEATWRDLEAWVFEIGLAPLAAIKWATLDAATYLGHGRESGSVQPGKLADLITVRGNPLQHFSILREPVMVFKAGVRFK